MRSWLDSLRLRLVGAMLLVFAVGAVGALYLSRLENAATVVHPNSFFLKEPFQDLSMMVPFAIVAIPLMWFVSGWSLRHVARASAQAARVGAADLESRIATQGLPAELRPLVEAFNAALDRLADAYETERRFVADSAHQLRTPLAVLSLRLQKAQLEGELDWRLVGGDLASLHRLVDQLLDLARKEHARNAERPAQMVDLSRIVREAAATLAPLAEQRGRELTVDVPTPLRLRGRPDDLRDMMRNLIENALVHGEGRIRVAGAVAEAGKARIVVGDEGAGVSPEFAEVAFDRFRRADPTTDGHGLGLAVVREVARGHGGSAAFEAGRGCRVRVELPLAAGPAAAPERTTRRPSR